MLQLPSSPPWRQTPISGGWKLRRTSLVVGTMLALASLAFIQRDTVSEAVNAGTHTQPKSMIHQPASAPSSSGRSPASPPRQTRYKAIKDVGQLRAIYRVTRCALGVVACPERPLIISDYEFIFNTEHKTGIAHGEEVWVSGVAEGIRQMGYEMLIFDKDEERTWNYTRLLDKSVHMYFTDANHAFRCFHNPHCVRQEDYVKPATHAIDMPPEPERGVLPAWRIFGLNFWGARPNKYNAIFLDAAKHWGINGDDGREEWSHHVLGPKWQIVYVPLLQLFADFCPFAYPGHTAIPMSIELACLQTPVVPFEEREDGILILAKHGVYMWDGRIKGIHPVWPDVVKAMKEIDIEFWLTANPDQNKRPFPEGMVSLGNQEPFEYRRRTSLAKAMLGVGMPSISPSPYEALCAGVPVVLPKMGNHSASGWDMFHPDWFQHGPLQALDPPYVYSYDGNDPHDLIDKLKAAVNTPIDSFVPPNMTLAAVFARVKDVISHDWEAEYHTVRAANGGANPGYKPIQWEKCWERGVCDPKVLSHRP